MSDTTKKLPTCADCPFCAEPVCEKLRPCDKSLPVCVDYPTMVHPAIDKISKDITAGVSKSLRDQVIGFKVVGSLPTMYLALYQKTEPDSVYPFQELGYTGYQRAEMCCLDWDWLAKVPAQNSRGTGFYRRFCHKPKSGKNWRVDYSDKCVVFSADGGGTLGSKYNIATNGTPIQYSKAMESWENIAAFGLCLAKKGGTPNQLFGIKNELTVKPNEHATFYQGSIEVPVEALMKMKLLS